MLRVLLAVLLLIPGLASAGTQDSARFALHAQAPAAKSGDRCGESPNAQGISCPNLRTSWPLRTPAHVYLLAVNAAYAPGVIRLEGGIQFWEGVRVTEWAGCADFDITHERDLPERTDFGFILIWAADQCQRFMPDPTEPFPVQVIGGSLYMYAYSGGEVHFIWNPMAAIPELSIADCERNYTKSELEKHGTLAFGDAPGYNPCTGLTLVEAQTWGQIKAGFE